MSSQHPTTQPQARWRSTFALLGLAIVPVTLWIALVSNRELFDPFFQLRNIDPAYAYLMNSMTMLCGHTPRHIDHPGTTLQILGAMIIGAINLLRGASPICPTDNVFTQPEVYLAGIRTVLQFAVAALLFALPARLYTLTGNLIAGLVVQVSFLVSTTIVSQLIRVQPEPLLMVVVLAMGWALLPLATGTRPESRRDAIICGAIFGFGVATKLTILPLVLFVFMFQTTKAKLRFLLACAGTFVLWTLPILSMNKRFFGWILNVAGHSGRYGEGEIGLPPLADMAVTALDLMQRHRAEFFGAGLVLAIAIWHWRRKSQLDPTVRFLLISVAVLLAQWAMTTKHPAPHYMIPALLVLAVANGIAAALVGSIRRVCAAIYLCAVILIGGHAAWQSFQGFRVGLPGIYVAEKSANERIRKIAAEQCGKLVHHDSNSDVQFALRFGDAFTEGRFRFRLAQLYPDFLFYNLGDDSFYNFSTYLGRDVPVGTNGKPTCTLGTAALPEGGARGIRRLAKEGEFSLYAIDR